MVSKRALKRSDGSMQAYSALVSLYFLTSEPEQTSRLETLALQRLN